MYGVPASGKGHNIADGMCGSRDHYSTGGKPAQAPLIRRFEVFARRMETEHLEFFIKTISIFCANCKCKLDTR